MTKRIMQDRDKIIQSLYLCTTTSREKMQQSMIENILYTLETPMSRKEIIEFVYAEYHILLDDFEIKELLEALVTEGVLVVSRHKYLLHDGTKNGIFKNVLENGEREDARKQRLKELIEEFDCQIEDGINEIVDAFNEYLYDCFLEYGRNAIRYFLPFQTNGEISGNLLKQRINKFKNPNHKKVFAELVTNYPEKLTSQELEYLESLAIKAEYFFSLGIPKEDFNKVQEISLDGLVVLVDTNIIYSLLGLHSHRQNDNCIEITRLIADSRIDCKLVYLKKTYEELKNKRHDFEKSILAESLTSNQIKSLLESDSLSSYAKEYFARKLIDPETPHPTEKIKHSSRILKSKKIQIYRHSFPHLEDYKYLNAKFADYYDYQNIVNTARVQKGLNEKPQKDDKKLEHDIYLREAILSLRKDRNKIEDLQYICLTLDRGLISFDRYANGKLAKSDELVAPNFILPSIFLRKIRPFIHVVSDDYRQAFITSITTNTLDTSLPQYSDAVQRSMTYFKKLGIDDFELIMSIIKQELFFEEFTASEKEDKQEEFLRSEIDKAYVRLKLEKEKSNADLERMEILRQHQLEKEKERHKAEMETANSDHEAEKEKFDAELAKVKEEKEKIAGEKKAESLAWKVQLLEEKRITLSDLNKQKRPIKKRGERKATNYKYLFCIVLALYFFILIGFVIRKGWEEMEPYTYFFGLGGVLVTYLFAAITGRSINPMVHFQKIADDHISKAYKEFNFNIERFNNLKDEVELLEKETKELKEG